MITLLCSLWHFRSCCLRIVYVGKVSDMNKAKKINAMSQSLRQIGRPDLNAFFVCLFVFVFVCLFFSEAADVSDLSRSQLWNMELDFGWTRYKTEHELKKSVVKSLSYLFLYILTSKFIKNWKKLSKQKKQNKTKQNKKTKNKTKTKQNKTKQNKKQKTKNKKPWILLNQTRTEKQMRAET